MHPIPMTNQELKELEKNLRSSANSLRAYGGLKTADYAVPVLGLIFLRFAENKYAHYKPEILKEFEADKSTRLERPFESLASKNTVFIYQTSHIMAIC